MVNHNARLSLIEARECSSFGGAPFPTFWIAMLKCQEA
jgi:hypothetical protein